MSEGTMDNGIDMMMRRIERLERSNRVMKYIALGAVVGCIALNALPAGSVVFPHGPKRVDAESFNLISPKGVLLATLQAGANGGQLAFFDATGKAEMLVGNGGTAASPSVGTAIFDGNAVFPNSNGVKDRVFEGISANLGVTTVGQFLLDPSGNSRLTNTINNDGTNAVSIYYDGIQDRAGIGLGTNGPGLYFDDSNHNARILESVTPDDASTVMTMLNSSGNPNSPLVDLSALGNGSDTTLQVEDGSGVQRMIEGYSTGSNEIILLHNASDTETFRAPCTGNACP